MPKRNLIIFALLAAALALFAMREQTPAPEKYIAREYPGYEIVKTAEVSDLQSYLIKNDSGMIIISFYAGKPLGALGTVERNIDDFGIYERGGFPTSSNIIIIGGENIDLKHTSYTLAWQIKQRQTTVTQDITNQRYVLDIYTLDWHISPNILTAEFEDGETF